MSIETLEQQNWVRTFQSGVEHETPKPDQKVAIICNLKDGVVAIFSATFDTLICEIDKHEVGQRVDDFGRVVGNIVVLFTPLESRGDRVPKPGLIREGREWMEARQAC